MTHHATLREPMRSPLLSTLSLALALTLGALTGCGPDVKCGANTVERDGACVSVEEVPVTACGPGTVRQGRTCVLEGAVTTDNNTTCTPSCDGRVCGDDGCGGSCGLCTTDDAPLCDTGTGQCVKPACLVACRPDWECGDDGCGGTCGTCSGATPFCGADNLCTTECVPQCDGKTCGDDGCGGSCGACGEGTSCNTRGVCVPEGWQCAPSTYNDGFRCDCACGLVDPDCAIAAPEVPIANCGPFQVCDDAGQCAATIPAGWTCAPERYGEGRFCDCNCGAPDPDCQNAQLELLGCSAGTTACAPDGSCGACTPDCNGKTCGDDGCGGLCGTCGDPSRPICEGGQCVGLCDPTPLRCASSVCGDDGCGGSCGTCPAGESCAGGQCFPIVDPLSCRGRCGQTLGQCACDVDCATRGDCCADVAAECPAGCVPDCNNRACGDDGCGGSCGTCAAGLTCFDEVGGCAPAEWICEPGLYNSGAGGDCDCGCGAPDPDCPMVPETSSPRCPGIGGACQPDVGQCTAIGCQTDLQCLMGESCQGAYYQGGRLFMGACLPPSAAVGTPGAPCGANFDCASDLCLEGICRQHCEMDAECLMGELCVSLELESGSFATPGGVLVAGRVAVCDMIAGNMSSGCTGDTDCPFGGQCLVYFDSLQQPLHLCTTLDDPLDINSPCQSGGPKCAPGLVCTDQTSLGESICARPCLGGVTDCQAGESCISVTVNDLATPTDPSDDVTLSVCVP